MATSVGPVREGQVLVCIGAVTDVVATLVGIGIQFGSAQADIVAPEASAVPCPTFADVGADVVTVDDICLIPVQPYSREAVIARKVKRERDVALEKTDHMRGEAGAEVEHDAGNSVKQSEDKLAVVRKFDKAAGSTEEVETEAVNANQQVGLATSVA